MQNKEVYTSMSTITLSTRLAGEEVRKIDELAGELGLDRGALLKQLIRKGYTDIQTERALDAYRHGTITLSRAAEIAGLSLRDLLLRLPEESIELNYDLRELQRDMEGV
jgi:predicted HTH domain antitoxin